MRHVFDFGPDRELVGAELSRPESWDRLRTQTSGPFALPATRAGWEAAALARPDLEGRARAIDDICQRRGVRRLATYGVGTAELELWLHRLAPERELICTENAPATADGVRALFREADVREHDLLNDPPLDAELHLFHRIDTEFGNRQWRRILRRFAAVPVLVAATEIIDVRRALSELRRGLHRRSVTKAGRIRTREAFEALWHRTHAAERVELYDLHGWLLEPRQPRSTA